MFGTLRLNPPNNDPGPIFVERADGAAFCALGSNVPQHMACDQCRQKKLRCTGRKSGCGRCEANSIDCTYTQISAGSGRRRRGRKQLASQRGHAWSRSRDVGVPSPSPSPAEGVGANAQPSTIIVNVSTPNSNSAPVTPGVVEHANGAAASSRAPVGPLDQGQVGIPVNYPEEQNHSDGQDGGLEGWDDEFLMFDLETAIAARRGFGLDQETTADSNPSNPGFHWDLGDAALTHSLSPHDVLKAPNDQLGAMNPDGLLDESLVSASSSSHLSTATTCDPPNHTPGGNESAKTCTNQCLQLMKSLLEETDATLHDLAPCQADAALSYQKRACTQCSQIIRRCKTCYVDPDCLMLLTLICDKLVMLNKKILWYTMEVPGNSVKRPLFAGQYEMDEFDEWGGMIQHLSGVQLRRIKMLVEDIEGSAGVEGREAHRILLRSVKGQVGVLLERIGRALSKDVQVPEL